MAKKIGVVRKLQEFGWLWAIWDKWSPAPTIKVVCADVNAFDAPHALGMGVWIYGIDRNGVPATQRTMGGWTDQLGSRVLCGAESGFAGFPLNSSIGERLEYVAIDDWDEEKPRRHPNQITIYRAPKGVTFWEFLQLYDPLRDRRV